MEQTKKSNIGLLLFALFLGYTMVYIDKLSVSFALIPMSEEFNLLPSAKGMIMSAFFLGYAIMQVPMGFVINKAGARAVLIFSVLGIGAFTLVFGFGSSLIMFMAIRFLTGFMAHSGYASSASKQLTLHVPREKRTFAQGILLSSSGFAGIVGPIIISPIITNSGWRTAYYILTAAAVLVTIVLIIAIPKEKKVTEDNTQEQAKAANKVSLSEVWSDKRVWVLFFSAFCVNALLYGLSSWVPSFLTEAKSLSLNNAALISAVAGVFALVGSLGGSYFVGKYLQGKEKGVVAVTAVLAAVATFLSYFVANPIIIAILLGFANFFGLICFIIMMSIPLKIFEGPRFAPSYATLATGGILGGFVSPSLIGYLVQASGGQYISSFIYFLIVGSLTAVAIMFIKQK